MQPKGLANHYEVKIWREFKKNGKVYKDETSERVVIVNEFDFDAHYTTPKGKGSKEEKTVMEKLGFKFEIVNKPL